MAEQGPVDGAPEEAPLVGSVANRLEQIVERNFSALLHEIWRQFPTEPGKDVALGLTSEWIEGQKNWTIVGHDGIRTFEYNIRISEGAEPPVVPSEQADIHPPIAIEGRGDEPPLEAVLGHLASRIEQLAALRLEVDELAQTARTAGATWTQIGHVAGITPQSAHQRWSEQGRERHRARQASRRTDSD